MTHYLVAEILGIFFLEAESVVICLLFPVLELDYEVYLLFFLYTCLLYTSKVKFLTQSDKKLCTITILCPILYLSAHNGNLFVQISDLQHFSRALLTPDLSLATLADARPVTEPNGIRCV